MVFADTILPRRQRCIPCERESALEGYQAIDVGAAWAPIEAGSITSAEASGAGHQSNVKSIALGVGTGIAVWVITRTLDKYLFKGARR